MVAKKPVYNGHEVPEERYVYVVFQVGPGWVPTHPPTMYLAKDLASALNVLDVFESITPSDEGWTFSHRDLDHEPVNSPAEIMTWMEVHSNASGGRYDLWVERVRLHVTLPLPSDLFNDFRNMLVICNYIGTSINEKGVVQGGYLSALGVWSNHDSAQEWTIMLESSLGQDDDAIWCVAVPLWKVPSEEFLQRFKRQQAAERRGPDYGGRCYPLCAENMNAGDVGTPAFRSLACIPTFLNVKRALSTAIPNSFSPLLTVNDSALLLMCSQHKDF
ncbi:hypothetical protein B0J11DRAFT_583271 [Dendryphion nanum]|uniref:Uncharacterized protein n=1 Tax=Dendryphion nanum TaxID=256645 RepID=A0A9P9IFW4_9PLEO|nr:hypothetical protein B0J11DRAFT_583271 [Dendryphion nanum]